jgi:hypothetical protein
MLTLKAPSQEVLRDENDSKLGKIRKLFVTARRIRAASRKWPTGYHSVKFDVMAKMIRTYYLHGIEAIPIDVIAGEDRAKIV